MQGYSFKFFKVYFVIQVLLDANVLCDKLHYDSILISKDDWPGLIYQTFSKDVPSLFSCAALCQLKRLDSNIKHLYINRYIVQNNDRATSPW